MRNSWRTAALTVVMLLAALPANARPGLPEYVGVYVAKTSAGLEELERQTPKVVQDINFLAVVASVGSSRAYWVVSGEHSTTRFKSGEDVAFILRVSDQTVDPASLVQLWRLTPKSGQRRMELAVASNLTSLGHDTYEKSAVAFVAEKYGDKFFIVRPREPLPPGEYWISTTQDRDAFCFGMDP